MARLFQTEKSRMGVLGQSLFKKDEAEFLRDSLTARKRSLLPIGNLYTILCIFIGKMVSKHTKKIVSEYDEDDDNDDEEEDNEEDEKDEDYEER